MKRMKFQDNKAFYRKLKQAVADGEEVEVVTNFTSIDEVPQNLRAIFELDSHADASWLDPSTRLFCARATAPVGFNAKPLYVLSATGAGAGIGFMMGGPFGAAVGGALGMAAGTIAANVADARETEVIVTKDGKLIIRTKRAQTT